MAAWHICWPTTTAAKQSTSKTCRAKYATARRTATTAEAAATRIATMASSALGRVVIPSSYVLVDLLVLFWGRPACRLAICQLFGKLTAQRSLHIHMCNSMLLLRFCCCFFGSFCITLRVLFLATKCCQTFKYAFVWISSSNELVVAKTCCQLCLGSTIIFGMPVGSAVVIYLYAPCKGKVS